MTGLDEPVNLLRSIAVRSRRTLLHLAYSAPASAFLTRASFS